MKRIGLFILLVPVFLGAGTPDESLDRLMKGNKRYVEETFEHPNRGVTRREETVSIQAPFAIVLGCSDSRVSPEIIFDQGIGDLFIVRVAGNVCGPIELDSLEFSALHFGSSIILVLGHKNCGAVRAVLDGNTKDIEAIATLIEPAVHESDIVPGNHLDNAIKMNVLMVVNQLKASPVISRLIEAKKIEVVGGYYDLETGKVLLLPST